MRARSTLSYQMLFGLLALCLFLMIGAGQEKAPPIPGKLVDVGGWRLHLNCTGKRQGKAPTVVLEAGSGDFSVDWGLVQPEVASFARVCSYDRAGAGWSELGPRPRTWRQVAYELHTALQKAGIKGPYVLVGQSLGGLLNRVYASEYPNEVAGMVLVDSTHDDTVLMLNGKLRRARELSQGRAIPPVRTTISAAEKELSAEEKQNVENLLKQMGPPKIGAPYNRLPAEMQAARLWVMAQPRHYIADSDPYWGEEFSELYAARQKQEYPLGDIPLVVLLPKDEEKIRQKMEFTKLSRNSKLIVAEKSGHHIQLDEPKVVTDAVRLVVEAVRRRTRLAP